MRTQQVYEQHGGEICRMLREGISLREIARKYGIWHTGLRKFCEAWDERNDQIHE